MDCHWRVLSVQSMVLSPSQSSQLQSNWRCEWGQDPATWQVSFMNYSLYSSQYLTVNPGNRLSVCHDYVVNSVVIMKVESHLDGWRSARHSSSSRLLSSAAGRPQRLCYRSLVKHGSLQVLTHTAELRSYVKVVVAVLGSRPYLISLRFLWT